MTLLLRILIDEPLCGAVNMAVDEAILLAVNDGSSPATLRFYRWSEPTISLGYFQKYDEISAQELSIRRLPIIRRQTGGGAILHDDEITYSLILPLDKKDGSTDIEKMYSLVHDAFITELQSINVDIRYRQSEVQGNAQRGPFFCFARRHRLDLVVEGEKLLGSAQRRISNAVLQHGSLILASHFEQQPCATLRETLADLADDDADSQYAPHISHSPTLPDDLNRLIEGVAGRIGDRLGLSTAAGMLSDQERARLETLQSKYAGHEWLRQR